MTAQQKDVGWKVALALAGTLFGGGLVTGKDYLQTAQLEARIEKRIDQLEERLTSDIKENRAKIDRVLAGQH